MQESGDTWTEWSKHVIHTLERLDNNIKTLDEKIGQLHDTVLQLKIRSSLISSAIGAATGSLLTLLTLVIMEVI